MDDWFDEVVGHLGVKVEQLQPAVEHFRAHRLGFWNGTYMLSTAGGERGVPCVLVIDGDWLRIDGERIAKYEYDADRLTCKDGTDRPSAGAISFSVGGKAYENGFETGAFWKRVDGTVTMEGEARTFAGASLVAWFGETIDDRCRAMRLFGLRPAVVVVFGVAGCGAPAEAVAPQPSPQGANREWGGGCTAKRDEADLMGWDAGSRANVAVMRRQGVLAVRFATDGCKVDLELLPNCLGEGTYGFSPYPASERRIARDQRELAASLPLLSVNLGSKITAGRALRTDFDLAGMASLPAGKPYARRDLHGQGCDRATHVVSRVYVGGFAIVVGESRSIEAAVTVFGAGVHGGDVRDEERLTTEGNADACKAAQRGGVESPGCSVPLRLALQPINDATSADYGAPRTSPNLDAHGCAKGRQIWNGRICEELKLDPNGHEIIDSLQLGK